ncbi:hypothetical protein [Streptomyces omiyaensis]|uniref:hypothetical protein n=1 Tax=Streptomyces omiyaensis TaxID=68247 RepID=UPI0036FFFB32
MAAASLAVVATARKARPSVGSVKAGVESGVEFPGLGQGGGGLVGAGPDQVEESVDDGVVSEVELAGPDGEGHVVPERVGAGYLGAEVPVGEGVAELQGGVVAGGQESVVAVVNGVGRGHLHSPANSIAATAATA